MGSKNSVFKRNKTISNHNGKNTIKNVFKKRNPVRSEKNPEDTFVPTCGEKEKAHENVGGFSKTPTEVQDNNCINSVILTKDNKAPDADVEVSGNSISEARIKDEIVDEIKTLAEKTDCSKSNFQLNVSNTTNDPNVETSEHFSRNNLHDALTSTSESHDGSAKDTKPTDSETALSDEEVDAPSPFDFHDQLFFLLGGNFSSTNHPVPCLTPRLGEEILNDEEVSDSDCDFAKKDFLERKFGHDKNKMIERFLLDTACSNKRTSDIVAPRNLNVAIVKGMIYRRELYGPPIDQAGQPGPSQPQVPIGTEEYVITKQYNYGKDDGQKGDKKTLGCTCIESWGKDTLLNPVSNINQMPSFHQPLKQQQSSENVLKLQEKGSAKDKKGTAKQSKKKGKKTGLAKKGSAKKEPKKVNSKKGTSKKTSTSAKSFSRELQKETPSKVEGKPLKNVTKVVKKPAVKKSSRTNLLAPEECDEEEVPSTSKSINKKVKPTEKHDFKTTHNPSSNKYMFVNLEQCGPSNIQVGVSRTDHSGYDIMFKDEGDMKVKVEKIILGKNRVFTYNSGNGLLFNDAEEKPIEMKTTHTLPAQENSKAPLIENSQKQAKKLIKINVKIPKNLDKQKKITKEKPADNVKEKTSTFIPNPNSDPPPLHPGSPGTTPVVHQQPHFVHPSAPGVPHKSSFVHPSAPGAHHDSSFVHPSAPGAHHESPFSHPKPPIAHNDYRKREPNRSFDEYTKPHNEKESRKISPSLVHESLQPIFEKFYPKNVGSSVDPNYTAHVQMDKCNVDGTKIECFTSIPNVKVVFDVPGAQGKKIDPQAAKSKIAISQYDIHVDVGLDRIGPKYLEQMSHKAGRYDSIVSSENLQTKADFQHIARKAEHADDGPNKLLHKPIPIQSIASIHSSESGVLNTDSSEKRNQHNEPNKFKSKLYDANKLLEIKECLSKMKLELRNECPCMASRHQDRLENKDKNQKTDRVIIIRTKRKEGGEECSDGSDSESEKEKEEALYKLANEMLGTKHKNKTMVSKSDKEEEEETKYETRGSSIRNESIRSQNKFDAHEEYNNNKEIQKYIKRGEDRPKERKSVRPTDDESLNHPELNERQKNASNDEETYYEPRGRRKRAHSMERGPSVWDHPESTVTEEEALLTKSIMKGAISKKALDKQKLMEDSHVVFKSVSSRDFSDTTEQTQVFRNRHPTGIFYQGQNLLAGTISEDQSPTPTNKGSEVSDHIAKNAKKEEQILKHISSRDTDQTYDDESGGLLSIASSTRSQQLEAVQKSDHKIRQSKTFQPNVGGQEALMTESRKNVSDIKLPKKDGSVGFHSVSTDAYESDEKRSFRNRQPTGIFHQGMNLLRDTTSYYDISFDDDVCSENTMSVTSAKNEKNSGHEKTAQNLKPVTVRDAGGYNTIYEAKSDNISDGSYHLKGDQPVQNKTIKEQPDGARPSEKKKEKVHESDDERVGFKNAGIAPHESDRRTATRNRQQTGIYHDGMRILKKSDGYDENNTSEPSTTKESTKNVGLKKNQPPTSISKKNHYLSKLEESSEYSSDGRTDSKRNQPVRNEAIQKTAYRLRSVSKNSENKGHLTMNQPSGTVKEHGTMKIKTKSAVNKEMTDKNKSGADAVSKPTVQNVNPTNSFAPLSESDAKKGLTKKIGLDRINSNEPNRKHTDGTYKSSYLLKPEADQANERGANQSSERPNIKKQDLNEQSSKLNSRKAKTDFNTSTKKALQSTGVPTGKVETNEPIGSHTQVKLNPKSENDKRPIHSSDGPEKGKKTSLDRVKSDSFNSTDLSTPKAKIPTVCRLRPKSKDALQYANGGTSAAEESCGIVNQVNSDALNSSESKISSKNHASDDRLKTNSKEDLHSSGTPKGKVEVYESTVSAKSDALKPSNSKVSTAKHPTARHIEANVTEVLHSSGTLKEKSYQSNDSLARIKSDALLITSDSKVSTKKPPTAKQLPANATEALRAEPKEKKAYISSDSLDRVKSNPLGTKLDPKKRSTVCRLKKIAKELRSAVDKPKGEEEAYKPSDILDRTKSGVPNPLSTKFDPKKRSTACRIKKIAKDIRSAMDNPKGKEEAYEPSDILDRTKSGASNSSRTKFDPKKRSTACRLKKLAKDMRNAMDNPKGEEEAYEPSDILDRTKSGASNSSRTKFDPNKRSTACRLKKIAKDMRSAMDNPKGEEEAYEPSDILDRTKSGASNSSRTKFDPKKRSTDSRLKKFGEESRSAAVGPKAKKEKLDMSRGIPRKKADVKISTSSLDYKSSDAVNLSNLKMSSSKDGRLKKAKTAEHKRKDLSVKNIKSSPPESTDSGVPIGKVLADHRLEKTILNERINNTIQSLCAKCPPLCVAVKCCCATARPTRIVKCTCRSCGPRK